MNGYSGAPGERQRTSATAGTRLNGIDYVEVELRGADGSSLPRPLLRIYFFDRAPKVRAANIRISGGRRVTDVAVSGEPEFCLAEDPRKDDCMRVWLTKIGDASTYTLCLADVDGRGRPIPAPPDQPGRLEYRALDGFDPRYSCIDFTFTADCPTDLDCATAPICPRPEPAPLDINYLAKDYESFRQLILDRLAVLLPDWQELHAPDLGITLVELLAYVGDSLSYYQDAVATEAYLDTARRRISVRRHARLVDYLMHEGCNARAWVAIYCGSESYELNRAQAFFVTRQEASELAPGALLDAEGLAWLRGAHEVFEPVDRSPVTLHASHNEIGFYTWDGTEACLPAGATRATLVDGVPPAAAQPEKDRAQQDPKQAAAAAYKPGPEKPAAVPQPSRTLSLSVGDVLIFEETLGPRSGLPADADPNHRHAVRLTSVRPVVDRRNGQPLLEIAWGVADALPFALCLTSIGTAPDCCPVPDVSVGRGNVVLVDHGGRTSEPGDLAVPPDGGPEYVCDEVGRPRQFPRSRASFNPPLTYFPITHAAPLAADGPAGLASAADWMEQDPREATPQVWLSERPAETPWEARRDLLASEPDDRHFVVEIDDDGRAWLRTGDGDAGKALAAGVGFAASYRVGNGAAGNVGAEAIAHLGFYNKTEGGAQLQPRNPLPAKGGVDPEPAAEVKMFAPHAFRRQLARAIVGADYGALAQEHRGVQRAAGALVWTGSWYEAQVAVDPSGQTDAGDALLAAIEAQMRPYRRIGHDLAVTHATYVPVRLEMTICVKAGYLRGHVEAALLDLFSNRALPSGGRSIFHPDNLTFGSPIYLSTLIAKAMGVDGVETATVDSIRPLDVPRDAAGDALAREQGVLAVGPFEIPRLDNDPAQPENGSLKLILKGGR